MPLSVVPTSVNEPRDPAEAGPANGPDNGRGAGASPQPPDPEPDKNGKGIVRARGSRWLDYDAYELVDMISELEDERRWARLREGILWAILLHIVLLFSVVLAPRYIFKVPPVIDPFEAIQKRKEDLRYLDLPPDLIKRAQPRTQVKPAPQKPPRLDKKTLEALNKSMPPQ